MSDEETLFCGEVDALGSSPGYTGQTWFYVTEDGALEMSWRAVIVALGAFAALMRLLAAI